MTDTGSKLEFREPHLPRHRGSRDTLNCEVGADVAVSPNMPPRRTYHLH